MRKSGVVSYETCALVLGVVISVGFPDLLHSQETRVDAETAVDCFVTKVHGVRNPCPSGVVTATAVTRRPHLYSHATVERVLDALQQYALSGSDKRARGPAVIAIANMGSRDEKNPWPGIVRRLGAIYRNTDDFRVRFEVANIMVSQSRTSESIALLTEIAADDLPADRRSESPPPAMAIEALAEFGAAGREAVRRLVAEGAITNPQAQMRVNFLFQEIRNQSSEPR